jgi:hypothetical protein
VIFFMTTSGLLVNEMYGICLGLLVARVFPKQDPDDRV